MIWDIGWKNRGVVLLCRDQTSGADGTVMNDII